MNDQAIPNGPTETETAGLPVFPPPTDVFETKDAMILAIDMPGADPGTLDVSLERRSLKVSATVAPSAPQGYALVYAEFRDGKYERTFTLPDPVDAERIDAVLKDGVLRLTLPKESPSPAKKITLRTS